MESSRGVIDGAFRILEALPRAGRTQQVARLGRLTGIPRPTVYRLLAQLKEMGAVEYRTGHWYLSARLLGLAQHVEPHTGLRKAAMEVIRPLREQTGGAVSLVVATDDAFVALEMVPGREAMGIDTRAGETMPASTAAGQLLNSPSWRVTRPSNGIAVNHGVELGGLTCYAVPVTLPAGQRVALQVATLHRPAEHFAAPVHRAAAVLEKQMLSAQRTTSGAAEPGRTIMPP
jgi:IclR family transcriptional regulator, acetate operon repressor